MSVLGLVVVHLCVCGESAPADGSPTGAGFPALNTRVEANQGPAPVLDVEENTTIVPTTNETVPTPIKLTPAEVGPLAP